MVITIPGSWTLCIEAKLESREGFYPTSASELGIFGKRFAEPLKKIGQFALQEFMFRRVLRVDAFKQVVIARDIREGKEEAGKAESVTPILTWLDVLAKMERGGSLPFVEKLYRENSTIRERGPAPAEA